MKKEKNGNNVEYDTKKRNKGKKDIKKTKKKVSLRPTWKKAAVDPDLRVPYWMSVCLERSSAFAMGVSMRSMVKKAARLAV